MDNNKLLFEIFSNSSTPRRQPDPSKIQSKPKPIENPEILEAQANFALKLLREVSDENESMVVSPISVAIALAMAYTGAKGQTAEEMGQVLAKGAPESEVHEYFGQLLRTINDGEKNYTLEVANKVYVKSGFDLLDGFKTAINSHYGGQFESVDFGQKKDTAKKINYFVEQATHEKIHDLIKPEMFDDLTRLLLVNAIYFKGDWAKKFNEQFTKKKPFYVSKGKEEEIDMMHKCDSFIYHENDELQALGLPYVGDDMFMFLVLPKKRFGLGEVLATVTGASLLKLLQMRHKQKVDVILPKFKLESTHHLNEPLKNIGMPDAFSKGANFSGIIQKEPLQISQVIQKAFIEINEEGTEAAAATAVGYECCCSIIIDEPPPPTFHADHPFALLLCAGFGTVFFGAIFRGQM